MAVVKPVVLRSLKRSLRSLGGEKAPVIAGHKLLYRCNLECQMFPFWRREDEPLLGLADEIRIMDALARAGVSFLGFEGGEPLLRRDVGEILREAHARFHTSLVTNGWLLEQRLSEIADHLDILFVSLDGIGATHDRLRGIPRSFERAVRGMRASRADVPTVISHTMTRENLDDTEKVVELAEQLEVGVTVQVAYDYRTAESLSPERARLRTAIERLRDLRRSGAPLLESVDYFDAILGSWYEGRPWRCKPWLTINIDPSGRIVLPCYVLQEYHGVTPVWDVDLRQLWNSFEWAPYESCNKCALACYLEPSLFRWTDFAAIRDRVIDGAMNYVKRTARASSRPVPSGPLIQIDGAPS
ncbi:MAG TPA: PTO1314 family radical SAM protein [Thermoplasmata archaeon]|nr:PTO1314 family radical SAM protein [Thermoplasmata archaeon]